MLCNYISYPAAYPRCRKAIFYFLSDFLAYTLVPTAVLVLSLSSQSRKPLKEIKEEIIRGKKLLQLRQACTGAIACSTSCSRETETGSFYFFSVLFGLTKEKRIKMERKVILVCSVVGFLGLLSAAAGFAAEATRIKGSQVQFPSSDVCIYPRSPALGLGLTAAVALMIAQVIINVSTGCICCRRGPHQSNSHWKLALICFLVSWFTFVVAFLLLLTGAALNDQHGEDNVYSSYYNCYVVKPGVFAGAAILSLASVILGLIYYFTLNSAKSMNNTWDGSAAQIQGGIAMGQPHFPPQSAQAPVFVHEDTYLRRQVA